MKQRGKLMTEFYKVNENKNPHFESLNNSSCSNGIREHCGEVRRKGRSPFNNETNRHFNTVQQAR